MRWLAASREACAGSGEQADNAGGEGLVADGALHDGVDRVAATTVLEDGCAAFSDAVHRAAIEGLRPVATITTIAKALEELSAAP